MLTEGTSYFASPYSVVIFDIGDVLFSWSLASELPISPRKIKEIFATPIWHAFERDRISQQTCYNETGVLFDLDPREIAKTFDDARKTLVLNTTLVEFIKCVKSKYNLAVYAMSNMSRPDFEFLLTLPIEWTVFDKIFISADAGMRKPDLCFYQHVIREIRSDPSHAIFVDDKLENVISARSLGMRGLVFKGNDIIQKLTNLMADPVERGLNFLEKNAGKLVSVTSTGVAISDNFSQLLILEIMGERKYINVAESPRLFNFFIGVGELTTEIYPCDLDTTSIAWTVLMKDEETAHSIMDEILTCCDSDGIPQVYFDKTRPRIDPVVCVNALHLFYTYGRGHELSATLDWVGNVLINRAYEEGTRYYASGECFLYFFSRLLSISDELQAKYSSILVSRLRERIRLPGNSVELAMRIVACASVDVKNEQDLSKLLEQQGVDGGWDEGWLYRYGMSEIYIGNAGLTTALALAAIKACRG